MKHRIPPQYISQPIAVTVAGAGGNGSQFLTGLARLHIALRALNHPGLEVAVYDPDIVTEANVGRQLFSPSDIGNYKAEVLVNRINCYYNLDWKAQPVEYTSGAGATDILVGCVDSIQARRVLARTRYTYWLDLGNSEKTGQVILGNPYECDHKRVVKETAHYLADDGHVKHDSPEFKQLVDQFFAQRLPNVTEIFPEMMNGKLKEDNTPSCSLAEALGRQDLFINQTISTFALQLLWQFIRQGGLDIHGYFINLESGRVVPLPVDPLRPYTYGCRTKPKSKRRPVPTKKKARK